MENNQETIFDDLTRDINNATMPEAEKKKMLQNVLHLRSQKLNIMITGGTGVGKSSTINALFDANVAKVGVGSTPETMDIKKYELKNLVLWDTPGLGDGKEADELHSRNIINKLGEQGTDGKALIDLVLVILDGSSRELGTSFNLINNVIIPNLGNAQDKKNRILVAINQCDVAMKGKHWNFEKNMPDSTLEKFLEEKVSNVQTRIRESTGVNVEPIYYSAGYKESDDEKQNPYNLSKLLYFIIEHTPKEKRLIYVDTLSKEKENWQDDDKREDYKGGIINKIGKCIVDVVEYGTKGAATGAAVGGKIFGTTGAKLGAIFGGVAGSVYGLFKGLFG